MQPLNLPKFECKIKTIDEKSFIFDNQRKKYIALTPEEWVRQHFVNFLINNKKYPYGLIGNEVGLNLNGMKKRSDTVVYDKEGKPLVIVEYKAPSIKITQEVFNQIVRYNMVLRVKYLIVSNGINHYCCSIDYNTNSYTFLKDIPYYDEL
ncbi:MAG: type I restriction enzyme HsdR N-terminal domain-containing protein [Bacteroidales bacterium]|nr:type I restriction enzyme HsdR N-terminal domain-containing protein [Bacteroidales bacterium]